MWLLNFIPDTILLYAIFAIMATGVILLIGSFIIKHIPVVKNYSTPVLLIGILITCASLYFTGGYGVEMEYRSRVAELEEKIKQAEQKSQQTNTVIQEKVVEKVKVIKGKTEYITQYLDREVIKNQEIIKYIEQCPVPVELIDIHNKAATMNVPDKKENK